MATPKALTVAGLLGLLVLDVVLITWALWPSSPPASAPPRPSQTQAVEAVSTPTESATEPEPDSTPRPITRAVAGVSSTTAWLVDAGSCSEPGRIHVTVDGGEGWSTQAAPGYVLRLRATDASAAFVVGGDAACEPALWYTGDRGQAWGPPQSTADAWGRHPVEPGRVLRPRAEPVEPCDGEAVLDLHALSGEVAAVVCAGGDVRLTSDRGQTWTTRDGRPGVMAVSLSSPGEGAVVGVDDACDGLAVLGLSEEGFGAAKCVEGVTGPPGEVALSIADGSVWLVAGDDILRSDRLGSPFDVVSRWPGA